MAHLPSSELSRLVHDYEALLATRAQRPLSGEESASLERLQDEILSVSADPENHGPAPRKSPRVRLALQVTFDSSADVAHAFTRDVGSGGLSIATDRPLPKGARVHLQVNVPGEADPLAALAEVVWTTDAAMGVAFRELTPEAGRRLKELVFENTSFIQRLRSVVGGTPGSVDAKVTLRLPVVIAVSDVALAGRLRSLLESRGFLAVSTLSSRLRPTAVIADLANVRFATEHYPLAPVVLVNATAADAVVARRAGIRPTVWVAPPSSVEEVVHAMEAAGLIKATGTAPGTSPLSNS